MDAAPRGDNGLRRATLGDALRRQALRQPRRPALVFHDAGATRTVLTYADLEARASRLARGLWSLGVRRGDVVAVLARNHPDVVAVYYAALKLGAAFTGLNPGFTPREIVYQVTHAEARVFVVEGTLATAVDGLRDALPSVQAFLTSGNEAFAGWPSLASLEESAAGGFQPDVPVEENDLALLVYTSGTEGQPKGVRIPHRNYLIGTTPALAIEGYLRASDVFLFVAPLYTIAGIGTVTSLLTIGATVVLVHPLTPARALEVIPREGITNMSQTPTFYVALTQAPGFAAADLRSLQQCHTYGGVIPRFVVEAMGDAAPGAVWASYWGQSELTQLGTVGWFRSFDDIPGQDPRWIGRPVAALEVRVVDEAGQDAEEGELLCRSPAVMSGYHKDPERTADVLRDGWVHTGDLVRIDANGNLFFVDRRKDIIKTGGLNVSSLEVEGILLLHGSIAEAAVVGTPDPYWIEAVTAFVVPRSGTPVDVADLLSHCRRQLAPYKVPKTVHLIEALPRDLQGKVLKRELRRRVSAAPLSPAG